MTGATDDPMHDLVGAFVLDALDDEERAAFEVHLAGCDRCRAEAASLAEAASFLGEGVATEPPTELRARVLDAVAGQPQDGADAAVVDLASRRRAGARWLPAAAAIVVGLGIGVGALLATGGQDVDAVAAAPDAQRLELDGGPGQLEVIWSPSEDRVAVIGEGLDDAGDGLVYALWFVLEDGSSVAPAGLFEPEDGSIETVLDVDDIEADGWGVTIEPDGGSPQPTGDILYVGGF